MAHDIPPPEKIVIRPEDLSSPPSPSGGAPVSAPINGPARPRPKLKARPVLPILFVVGAIAALGIVVLLFWMSTREGSSETDATLTYWNQLREIEGEIDALESTSEPATVDETKTRLQSCAKVCRDAAERISRLPVLDVEHEVVELGSQEMGLLGERAILCDELVQLIEEGQNFRDRASSAEAFAESFLRGMFGDPLGSYEEMKAEAKQLGTKYEKLTARMHELESRQNALAAQVNQLRSTLSRRYDREFLGW